MQNLLIIIFLLSLSFSLHSQANSDIWCITKCDAAGDELHNISSLYQSRTRSETKSQIRQDALVNSVDKIQQDDGSTLLFPIRIAIVDNQLMNVDEVIENAKNAIINLNVAYNESAIEFIADTIEIIKASIYLEDLYENGFSLYNEFSAANDKSDRISLYIFDHGEDFCEISEESIRCGKISGFSYIFSDLTSNIVMSNFDLADRKVVAHEFGHFFGLYHPFEEQQFGKDNFNSLECSELGDRICDTPPDPGVVYEVYVNYSECEMMGLADENGNTYRPLLTNYMSYYKPCYLKEYSFTDGQIDMLRMAAKSDIREKYQLKKTPKNQPTEAAVKSEKSTKRKCWFSKKN